MNNKFVMYIFAMLIVFVSCKNSNVSEENKPNSEKVITSTKLPKYTSCKELLADANDFSEEEGTLKFISLKEGEIHIQISKFITENDLEEHKWENVKSPIVYVAFQIFAQTDINKLTITSVPTDFKKTKKYFEKYKTTVSLNKERAKFILKKYLNTEDFGILFKEDSGIWYPNDNFDIIKNIKINEVAADFFDK